MSYIKIGGTVFNKEAVANHKNFVAAYLNIPSIFPGLSEEDKRHELELVLKECTPEKKVKKEVKKEKGEAE